MNATLSRKSTSDRETRKSGEPCAAFLSHEEGNHSVLRQDRFICCPEIHVQADSLCQHLSAHFSKTGTFTSRWSQKTRRRLCFSTYVTWLDEDSYRHYGSGTFPCGRKASLYFVHKLKCKNTDHWHFGMINTVNFDVWIVCYDHLKYLFLLRDPFFRPM